MIRKGTLTMALMLLPAVQLAAGDDGGGAGRSELKVAASVLKAAMETSKADDVSITTLQSQLGEASRQLGPDHLGAEVLGAAIKDAGEAKARGAAVAGLRKAAEEVYGMLTFEPVIEADSPEGFPSWTPVGQIEVKAYPEYRLARTPASSKVGSNLAFFKLFAHIKSNKIEMTAPVEMTFTDDDESERTQASMAFLYESTDLGSTGKTRAGVEVVDVPSQTVVSLGVRGPTNAKSVVAAFDELDAWLKRSGTNYEADGPGRVMGHNSPGVRGMRRYFEVQIPVRAVDNDQAE